MSVLVAYILIGTLHLLVSFAAWAIIQPPESAWEWFECAGLALITGLTWPFLGMLALIAIAMEDAR